MTKSPKKALGFHFLIELFDCDKITLKDVKSIESAMNNAIHISGATEVGRIFHEFSPHGISGVILISESHFSIHTWPEYAYAAVDLFTCNKKLNIEAAYQQLTTDLKAKRASIKKIDRGIGAI